MGSAVTLRIFTLAKYDAFHPPPLVTLGLIDPENTPNDILRFICLFPDLDNLSVVKYPGKGTQPVSHYETSPNFYGVVRLKHMDSVGKGGFVQGLPEVAGGLWFQELVFEPNEGAEPLISTRPQTLRTLLHQLRRSGVREWRARRYRRWSRP